MFPALHQRRPARWAAAVAAVTVLSLAAALMAPVPVAAKNGAVGPVSRGPSVLAAWIFLDMDPSHWAAPFVGPMHRLAVIRGYPDGRFYPNKSVSQVEALVMVLRALGYDEDELDPTARYRGLPRAAAWAEPYVALADDIGLLDELPGFNPQKAASRAWVAALLVAAAGVDEEAVEEALGLAPFRDMDDVPPEVRVMVRLAAALGWFQGYPGNWFQPNRPVTRAEMAALIARFLDYEDLPALDGVVRGTIVEVDDEGVTLRERSGTRTYRFAREVTVVVNDRLAGIDDLAPGMKAWAHVVDREIVHISARGKAAQPATFQVTGVIEQLRASGSTLRIRVDGQTYDVDPKVKVYNANNRPIGFKDLQVDWEVQMRGEVRNGRKVVTEIRVLDEGVVERVVKATVYQVDVDAEKLEVVLDGGTRKTRVDAEGVPVYHIGTGGQASKIAFYRLTPGDALELVYENEELVEIRRTGRGSQVIGVIASVTLDGPRRGLMVDLDLDAEKEDLDWYPFAALVDVADELDGRDIRRLDQLRAGFEVRLTLDAQERIIRVVVTGVENDAGR